MKRPRARVSLASMFTFSLRDCAIALLILTAVTVLCSLLHPLDVNDMYAPMLYVPAVFLIARYTRGYLFGLLGSIIGVVLVNFIFTYPYFAFNFTISGYPITFISMFVTSAMTSTMTSRIKLQDDVRVEAEKEKMRGNLLRAVSHDLRTPLTSILGTTSALLDNGDRIPPEQQRELLRESHDDAEWLIRMVENLLSITRMGGETRIEKMPEAVEEIVGEAVRKFNKRFPEVDVIVTVPDELLIVPMDAILIEQVIINLLENAVIHGGNTDGIAVTAVKSSGSALLSVSDNGCGVPDSALPHLFDGYLSGSGNSESDNTRNMGIGLSVCMSIMRAHGGTIVAGNKPKGGAVFCARLPLEES